MRKTLALLSSEVIHDVIVIGGGPGGYVASIFGAQQGLDVCCVDKNVLGGTCLNVGCIPSKTLLHASETFVEVRNQKHLSDWGIDSPQDPQDVTVDLTKLQKKKNKIINGLTKGVEFLFGKNKITYIKGEASLLPKESDDYFSVSIAALQGNEDEVVKAKNIVIASGSAAIDFPFLRFDEDKVLSSTGALDLETIPEEFAIIGAGVIGLELGSVYARFGSKVTVVEFCDEICPFLDKESAKILKKNLKKNEGFDFLLSHKVCGHSVTNDGKIELEMEKMKDGSIVTQVFDKALLAIGRRPYYDNLAIENLGIETTEHGFIQVDELFKTNVEGVYAIGDCIPGPMLAHKAEEDGVMVMEYLAEGRIPEIDYTLVPSVIYTTPEVASVGKTEQELKEENIKYVVTKFPYNINSRAKAIDRTEGFVKFLSCPETKKILGMHMVGDCSSEMIMEGAICMKNGITIRELSEVCHPHPTLSESIKEASMKQPIHM